MDGTDYGAPLENLKAAMRDAGLDQVDLWIGTGGIAIARLLTPLLKPKAYLPVHWDDFFAPFENGVTTPYSDPELEAYLRQEKIKLIKPHQYMDKWRLDATGITPEPNERVKRALGFSDAAPQPADVVWSTINSRGAQAARRSAGKICRHATNFGVGGCISKRSRYDLDSNRSSHRSHSAGWPAPGSPR